MADPVRLHPQDRHNRELVDLTHPDEWVNPTPARRYNMVVLGGGTAGLVAAIFAAGLGGRVALVEEKLLGGDCLVSGCVPSKALLASARAARAVRTGSEHGVQASLKAVDFAAVMERMRRVRAGIARHDSALRVQEAGVDVFLGRGIFTGQETLRVGEHELRFSRACVATGASPVRPPIPGLGEARLVTHEQLFELTHLPGHLLVLGGGPLGCEQAQAFRRFGSEVTLVEQGERLLPAEEPEASAAVEAALVQEGVRLRTSARIRRFEGGTRAVLEAGGRTEDLVFDLCLLATGRSPNTRDLGLEAVGVDHTEQGITVDAQLCTTNPRIYAAGDCASRFRYTHAADALARIVVQNALFFGRRDHTALTIPRVTYTDPEVAHVGLEHGEAADQDELLDLARPFESSDRAVCEGRTEGYLRAWCRKDSTILGATIVGQGAGDLIATMALAMQGGLGMKDLSSAVFPYPTRAFELHRLGDDWNRQRLTGTALSGPVQSALGTFLRWRR